MKPVRSRFREKVKKSAKIYLKQDEISNIFSNRTVSSNVFCSMVVLIYFFCCACFYVCLFLCVVVYSAFTEKYSNWLDSLFFNR